MIIKETVRDELENFKQELAELRRIMQVEVLGMSEGIQKVIVRQLKRRKKIL